MQDTSTLKMYSITDVAKILGVTYRTVLNYKKEGKLAFVQIGKQYRISEDNLRKFLNGES